MKAEATFKKETLLLKKFYREKQMAVSAFNNWPVMM